MRQAVNVSLKRTEMYFVSLIVLAFFVQRVVCAPASIASPSRDGEIEDTGLQLQVPPLQEEEHTSKQKDLNPQQQDVSPLDAIFPSSIDDDPEDIFTTPSRHYSTLLARRLLALSSTAILSTVFPQNISDIPAYARTPTDVAGISIGLPEYIADCSDNGDVTIIALGVSTSTKNVKYADGDGTWSGNVSLSISWWDQYSRPENAGHEPWSMADLPRVSLLGYLEEIPKHEVQEKEIEKCFVGKHRDARLWVPGSKSAAHLGVWARVVVQEVYWIGGFGGRNYIGWLDSTEWAGIKDEWKKVRLRGEH